LTTVTFLLPGCADLDRLGRLDPDRSPDEFRRGERAWVLQTFIRLAAAGHPVGLSSTLPQLGAVVYHTKHRRLLAAELTERHRPLLVAVRADNSEALLADVEILQNGRWAGPRRFHVAHWPQPGLLPRDPGRGDRVERAAFKGLTGNLHPGLSTAAFRASLAGAGIELELDAAGFEAAGEAPLAWHDYRDVDVVVAVRPPDRRLHPSKPATKLINAWHAGVPAVLGPEHAYRELRRDPLDYLEAGTPAEASAAILRLRAHPGLYRAMVENGRRRAAEVSVAAITARWAAVLFQQVPAAAAGREPPDRRRRLLRAAARRALQLLALRPRR
jgi:hypothetical protein